MPDNDQGAEFELCLRERAYADSPESVPIADAVEVFREMAEGWRKTPPDTSKQAELATLETLVLPDDWRGQLMDALHDDADAQAAGVDPEGWQPTSERVAGYNAAVKRCVEIVAEYEFRPAAQAPAPATEPARRCCTGPLADGTHPRNCVQRCYDCEGDPDGPERCRCRAESPVAPAASEQPDRVEVIIDSERRLIAYGASDVETAVQDEGRTLKMFLREPQLLHIPSGWRSECPDDRPAASEDTPRAAATLAEIRHTQNEIVSGLADYLDCNGLTEPKRIANLSVAWLWETGHLAARGLLADGTDRQRIEKALTIARSMAEQVINGPEADAVRAIIAALSEPEGDQAEESN